MRPLELPEISPEIAMWRLSLIYVIFNEALQFGLFASSITYFSRGCFLAQHATWR